RSSGHATRKERTSDATPPRLADDSSDDDSLAVSTWATLFNVHTGEAMPLSASEPTQDRFCDSLADRTTSSRLQLDPHLLELLRQIALRNPGARLELVSGYRSPKLNEMLRKKGHHVATHSQHSLGHAVDFRIIGF